MDKKKKVLAISGSTRKNSSNLQILQFIKKLYADSLDIEIYNSLDELPHFNPDLDKENPPPKVQELRTKIKAANGVLICTPEYVFSLPGSLKNAIEWTVSTTVFSEKPVAFITASGLGEKAHEALALIMKTIYAITNEKMQLLIQGARARINTNSDISDEKTLLQIKELVNNFMLVMNDKVSV